MTHTIVLAEDSLVMRAVVRRCLEDHGYVVIEAEDGAEALTACKTVSSGRRPARHRDARPRRLSGARRHESGS